MPRGRFTEAGIAGPVLLLADCHFRQNREATADIWPLNSSVIYAYQF
jgi:hypothetical protein